jgi:hypothetical protein
MHPSFRMLAACLLGILIMGQTVRADSGHIAGQSFHAWTGFGVGSSTTLESTIVGPSGQQTITVQEKLIEKADDHLVLEGTATFLVAGQPRTSPPIKETLKAAAPDPMKDLTQIGAEEVTVAGRTFSCKIYTVSSPAAAGAKTVKLWMCSDVPGGLVKGEVDATPMGKVNCVLKSFEAK